MVFPGILSDYVISGFGLGSNVDVCMRQTFLELNEDMVELGGASPYLTVANFGGAPTFDGTDANVLLVLMPPVNEETSFNS